MNATDLPREVSQGLAHDIREAHLTADYIASLEDQLAIAQQTLEQSRGRVMMDIWCGHWARVIRLTNELREARDER